MSVVDGGLPRKRDTKKEKTKKGQKKDNNAQYTIGAT